MWPGTFILRKLRGVKMQTKIFSCVIFILMISVIFVIELPNDANAQVTEEWVARYDAANTADWANGITVGPSGNIYVTGHSYIGYDSDYATVAYDPNGNELWVTRYDGPAEPVDISHGDYPYDIVVDSSENIYVTGKSRSVGKPYDDEEGKDIATLSYDSNGNQLWLTKYNGPGDGRDIANVMDISPNGNIIVSGESRGVGTDTDYVTIAYNSIGNQLWVARYNGPGNNVDEIWDMEVDKKTMNIYVTGRSTGLNNKYDYATIAYDSNGTELWVRRYDGPANLSDEAVALALDSAGTIYVTGTSNGVPSYNHDITTIAYDSLGTQLWISRSDAGSMGEYARDIAIDNSGRIYVTGHDVTGGDSEYFTVGIDKLGNTRWTARYDGAPNNSDRTSAIVISPEGLIFVTGMSNSQYPNYSDYATVIYDFDGNELFVAKYNGPGSNSDMARAMTVDFHGNVYVTGGSKGISTGTDFTTIKYPSSNDPPNANAGFDQTVNEGDIVQLNASASYDPDDTITTYEWDFDSNDGLWWETGASSDSTSPTPTHIYGDDGVFVATLRVTDNDNLTATDICNITVLNANPIVEIESVTMDVEIGLRVAGRKYNDVGMAFFEDGISIGYVSIERIPGSPDDQMAWIPISIDFSKSYIATVTYVPEDPQNIGANPVWVYIKSQSGSIKKIHHTFNVQQSKKRDSDHWNHIEPWEVNLSSHFIGIPFEITSHITDPGSDDEYLIYTYSSQIVNVTYLNNPPNPDLYPSPEHNPRDIMDKTFLIYEGIGTVTLVVKDDDNIRSSVGQGSDSTNIK